MDGRRKAIERKTLGGEDRMSGKIFKQIGLFSCAAVTVAIWSIGSEKPVVAQDGADAKCAGLSRFLHPDLVIESAALQPAQAPVSGANAPNMSGAYGKGPAIAGLPAFCRVKGSIHPEPGSDIKFEAWLPQGWNGRYTGMNSGGLAGAINYLDLAAAVRAGHATSGTDTGHATESAFDGSWAKGNPQKIRDYGWRAVHLTTVAGKKLAEAYYGRKPDKSYFVGCSNGGRQGLMEASRFPEDYDGIVVGAPAIGMTHVANALINVDQALSLPGAALSKAQIPLIQSETLNQCDALDGLSDGLVDDPRRCKIDYTKMACGVSASPQCLSSPQITALKRIVDGVPGKSGRPLAYGYPLTGGEVGKPIAQFGWDGNHVVRFKGVNGEPNFGDTILQYFPKTPFATAASFDFKRDGARLKKELGGDVDTTPNMTRFFARGGKMILWHGWSDAILPPQWSIDLHRDILRQSGKKAKDNLQFFMMPGVQHCMGGPGADAFGQIGAAQSGDTAERSVAVALLDWVEKGRKPESLVGRRDGIMSLYAPNGKAERQKLHCAWPKKAVLSGGGDPDKAADYRCK
jgi:Tannase and feruloyl esterase